VSPAPCTFALEIAPTGLECLVIVGNAEMSAAT
jgi:hypothetical protein